MKPLFSFGAVLLIVGAAQAQDQPPVDSTAVITNVTWEQRPSIRDEDYPPIPLALQLSHRTVVRCIALADGSVGSCEALSDDFGLGFNDAAIRVVRRGRLNPRTVDGVAENATFRITIPFDMEPMERPMSYAGPEPSEETVALFRGVMERSFIPSHFIEDLIGPMSAEDRDRVYPHFVRAFDEKGNLWVDAMALGFARQAPAEVVEALAAGLPPPQVVVPIDVTAMDRVETAVNGIITRARQSYCAQNGCPPP